MTVLARRTVAVLAIFLGLGALSPAFGLEVRRYDEKVLLSRDGSATVQLSLTLAEPPGTRVLTIPLPYEAVRNLKATGSATAAVREGGSPGNLYAELTLSEIPQGAATVGLSFGVADYYADGDSPGLHGNLDFGYRFVNVSFSRIAEFSADVTLPEGYVFATIGDFVPQPKKGGMASPYVISRVAGRNVVSISLTDLRLGDEVKLNGTFKSTGKSKILLFFLIALAIGSLFFFRDALKNGNGGGTKS